MSRKRKDTKQKETSMSGDFGQKYWWLILRYSHFCSITCSLKQNAPIAYSICLTCFNFAITLLEWCVMRETMQKISAMLKPVCLAWKSRAAESKNVFCVNLTLDNLCSFVHIPSSADFCSYKHRCITLQINIFFPHYVGNSNYGSYWIRNAIE